MMEARTFSPSEEEDVAAPIIGRCMEVVMSSGNLPVTLEFFENAGFLATDEGEPDRAWLATPGLTLALTTAARAAGRSWSSLDTTSAFPSTKKARPFAPSPAFRCASRAPIPSPRGTTPCARK